MITTNLAKTISQISKKELGLLYYFPSEIQRALNNRRAAIIYKDNKLAGFGFLTPRGKNYAEIHTLYVSPKFRGQGILNEIISSLVKLSKEAQISRAFFFTLNPAVKHVAENFNAQQKSFWSLPFKARLKILSMRLNPRRWISYLKYLKTGVVFFSMFVIEKH